MVCLDLSVWLHNFNAINRHLYWILVNFIITSNFVLLKAFVKAWDDFCGKSEDSPTLLIPSGHTFLLKGAQVHGPCKAKSPHIQAHHFPYFFFFIITAIK